VGGRTIAVVGYAFEHPIFDCGRVLFGSRVAKMRRRVTVHTRHQLMQASEHHKQNRASLVATEAIVVETPRTIVVVLQGTVGAPRVMAGSILYILFIGIKYAV